MRRSCITDNAPFGRCAIAGSPEREITRLEAQGCSRAAEFPQAAKQLIKQLYDNEKTVLVHGCAARIASRAELGQETV
jgi:hypothetical protein